MNPIEQLVREAIKTTRFHAKLDPENRKIALRFKQGRSQTLEYAKREGRIRISSLVATASVVENMGRDKVIYRCWQRNRYTDVTSFSLDRRGRLVGQIEYPLETLDAAELAFYLETLAIECDRFEFVFSGADLQ